MKRLEKEYLERWSEACDYGGYTDDDGKYVKCDGLDYETHINEFVVEGGERVIYVEDGMYYIAHGFRIGENDGEFERTIINYFADCGVEFEEK